LQHIASPGHDMFSVATRQETSIADSGTRGMQPSDVLTCTQQPDDSWPLLHYKENKGTWLGVVKFVNI